MARPLAIVRYGAALVAATGAAWVTFGPAAAIALAWNLLAGRFVAR